MNSRDIALISASTAAGAAVAALALRYISWNPRKRPSVSTSSSIANGCEEGPPKQSPFDPRKRQGYLSWDDYFMAIAFLSAKRSKDPNRQVGACLVSEKGIILGIGYNGFPRGCSDNKFPWAKQSISGNPLETKYPYVCHAEVNAILNTNHASAVGQRLYVTMFPCNECAKVIIQEQVCSWKTEADSCYKESGPRHLLITSRQRHHLIQSLHLNLKILSLRHLKKKLLIAEKKTLHITFEGRSLQL